MSNIPGYPQQIPFEYINLLPGLCGGDRERVDYHMRNFWNFFLSYLVDDYVEDMVMKFYMPHFVTMPKNGMITSPRPTSRLWSNSRKFFSRDGVSSKKISQYY
jgi:hypothetical protein